MEKKHANFLVFFMQNLLILARKKKALCNLSHTRNKGLVVVGSFKKSFMYVGEYTNLY